MKSPSKWPKPLWIPWSSLVFIVLNASAIYALLTLQISVFWMIPSLVLNMFFFWAEQDIYKREKRNFDSWNKEMGYLMGVTDREGRPLAVKSSRPQRRKKRRPAPGDVVNGPQTV